MNRREVLRAFGAAAVSAAAGDALAEKQRPREKGNAMTLSPSIGTDDYFLSPTNPTATADQRDLEALSMRVAQLPAVLAAKEAAVQRWKATVGRDAPAEAWGQRFDDMIEGYVFNSVMKAVNSDPNYPKVLGHWEGPPHEWFGMKVPDSRAGGGDCPDNTYSFIPIDGHAHYEIACRRFSPGTADVPFTAMNFTLTTLSSLDWQDVKIQPDGRFVVTVGPEPAKGRPNHLQTKIGANMLLIRDSRSDWRQIPNAYRVRRLDRPTAPPLTTEQMADRAVEFILGDIPTYYCFTRTFAALDANTISPPFNMGRIGGLVSQTGSWGRLKLADDEAFVVTLGSGGAAFRDLVLHDPWFRTLDYWNRTSNLNNAQAVPNPDGSFTYVIAIRDPGVYNWLDTGGLHDLQLLHRWQGLPRHAVPEGTPWVKGELVKLDALDKLLPAGTRRVTPEERQQQLAERLETFKLRYVDR